MGSVSVTVVEDVLEYMVESTDVVSTSIVRKDFTVKASALVIAGQTIEPRRGDRITIGAKVYAVVPSPVGPPALLQPGGLRWSIHTNEVSE
jgi:hypothetical protein